MSLRYGHTVSFNCILNLILHWLLLVYACTAGLEFFFLNTPGKIREFHSPTWEATLLNKLIFFCDIFAIVFCYKITGCFFVCNFILKWGSVCGGGCALLECTYIIDWLLVDNFHIFNNFMSYVYPEIFIFIHSLLIVAFWILYF